VYSSEKGEDIFKSRRAHALMIELGSQLGRLRQEDGEFQGSLGEIAKPCLKKAKTDG
jgi:hypothetical protein